MEQHTDAVFRLTTERIKSLSKSKQTWETMHRGKIMNSNQYEAITINQLHNTKIKKCIQPSYPAAQIHLRFPFDSHCPASGLVRE